MSSASINPKKTNFNGNSSHEAGSDGLEKPSGERKLTQRKKYVHRVSTVQTMAGINIPRGAAAVILEFEDSFGFSYSFPLLYHFLACSISICL